MLFVAYCMGNIIGPQLFLTKEAPKYEVSDTFAPSLTSLLLTQLRYRRD
jgi:hypothetical protein